MPALPTGRLRGLHPPRQPRKRMSACSQRSEHRQDWAEATGQGFRVPSATPPPRARGARSTQGPSWHSAEGDSWLRVGTKHQLPHSFTRANLSLQAAFWNKCKSAQLVSAWYLFRGLCQAAVAFITCCSRSSFTRPQKL